MDGGVDMDKLFDFRFQLASVGPFSATFDGNLLVFKGSCFLFLLSNGLCCQLPNPSTTHTPFCRETIHTEQTQ
jgi:hypothetical protein